MAAEPNPYFDPYLRSATPTGRNGGSAYPTDQQYQQHGQQYHDQPHYGQQQHYGQGQHGYPPQEGPSYFMQAQGVTYTPGASSSQYEFHQTGYPTPNEQAGLLHPQGSSQQHPYGVYNQQPPRAGTPQSIRLDSAPGAAAAPAWTNEKMATPVAAGYSNNKSRKKTWICVGVVLVILVAAGVVIGIIVKNKKSDDNDGGSTAAPGNFALSGGDGSMVTDSNGKQFQYSNKFGGNWLFDSANPWNGGKANSWTPAINETWKWGQDRIFGVNLGGWLVLEAFITPSLFEKTHSMDEWTMHGFLTKVAPTNPTEMLEEHYSTFITEQDFAQIAGAGLNWVRLPIPYWAIEIWEGEQFIPRIQWKYFLKAIEWARKYGLRINLDLHGVPGSQNGWNHSGRMLRNPNWLKTPMGTANAQRSLSYIRVLTQFISQEQYTNVVPMFGIVNEPYNIGLLDAPVKSFYAEAYRQMRSVTGIGKGPVMSIFAQGTTSDQWTQKFLPGADRVALDAHPYWAFGEASQTTALELATTVCKAHAVNFNTTWNNVGPVSAGEWSLAINDCGKWVGQGNPIKYELKFGTGACQPWDDYTTWTADTKAGFQAFWKAQWDALGDAFFWTWKIGPSAVSNKIEAPFWSYQLGLEQGWIGTDPRESYGYCASLGVPETVSRPTTLKPNQVGQDANAVPSDLNSYPWPPTAYVDVPIAANVPQYTPTGTIITMPGPTFTDPANPQKTIDAGTGWFNAQDTEGMYVPVSGCTYPDPWAAFGTTPTKCP